MFLTIAVTTDFSETSRQAFRPAAILARKLGMRLTVLHIDPGPQIHTTWQCPSGSTRARDQRESEMRARLELLVEDEPAFRGLGASPRVILGQPEDVLPALHADERIDLLVLSSRAHDDVKHFVPGSFAARALHLARCPVLILRSTPQVDRPFEIKRLLVPIDFSASSLAALALASSLAAAFQASLELLSVMEASPRGPGAEVPGNTDDGGLLEDPSERARRLEELSGRIGGGRTPRVVVRSGCPAEELLEEAAASKTDLIVMGSRGLSPIEQITLGSVAESAIQKANCPVLVVKEDGVPRSDGSGMRATGKEGQWEAADVPRHERCYPLRSVPDVGIGGAREPLLGNDHEDSV